MVVLTKEGEIQKEDIHIWDEDSLASLAQTTLFPLAFWLEEHPTVETAPAGILLQPDDDPSLLAQAPILERCRLIAINFPSFSDGRGFSLAKTIRHLGYSGELRAVGDIIIDQLYYLSRVGFDSFQLDPQQDLDAARQAVNAFTVQYQA